MKCTQIRSIISKAFDADTITQLPGEVQQHLRHCRKCARYYDELLQLENSIIAHRQIEIPGALASDRTFEDFSARLSGRKRPAKSTGRNRTPSFIPAFTRMGWALVAAVIIIISILFLNKPAPLLTNERNNTPYLKEAQLDNRPAQVIIYKTDSKYNLTVFWLYQ